MIDWFRRKCVFFPIWPLLAGVILGVCIAEFFLPEHLVWYTVGLLPLSFFLRKQRWLLMFLWGSLIACTHHSWQLRQQASYVSTYKNTQSSVTGVVVDVDNESGGSLTIKTLTINGKKSKKGKMLIEFPSQYVKPYLVGDVVSARGSITEIRASRNPYGFSMKPWLHRRKIDLQLFCYQEPMLLRVSQRESIARAFHILRDEVRRDITRGIENESSEAMLIRAVVLGEKPPQKSTMVDDFRRSGTLHVFAVSGLHVGMVGGLIGAALWLVRAPRWLRIPLVLLAMFLYVGLTGMRPPAMRAFIMATCFLVGILVRRRAVLLNSLGVSACIVLLLDGHQLFMVGFQLSYGVLLSIALFTGLWMKILTPLGSHDPFLPYSLLTSKQERWLKMRRWLRGSLSVSTSAWMGSSPLMWFQFGIITPIAIFAGIPLVAMVFCVLALAVFSMTIGNLWQPAQGGINQINAQLAQVTHTTATAFAHIPGGHWYRVIDPPARGEVIVYDLPYGGGSCFLDLGNGYLLDCGEPRYFFKEVLPTFKKIHRAPSSLIATHADNKHTGAMVQCLDILSPKSVIIPEKQALSPSYRKFVEECKKRNLPIHVPHVGEIIPIKKGVWMEILHSPADLDGRAPADHNGLVIKLHWHGWKILFTGDAGFDTEYRMLDSGVDLSADVVVSGRNRHDFTGSDAFFEKVRPRAVITTRSKFPPREDTPKHWWNTMHRLNIQVLDLSQTGGIRITQTETQLTLKPTIKGYPPIHLKKP